MDFFSLKKNGLFVSHLLFADDILLFNKANKKNIQTINKILTNYSIISGLNLNLHKSKVWFSKQVDPQLIIYFSNTLNINVTPNLRRYLGLPLKPNYKKSDFDFVIDKIDSKLMN